MSLDKKIFYFFSKFIPIITSPLGLGFLFLFISLIKNSRKSLIGAIIILFTFSNGFVANSIWKFLESPWERKSFESAKISKAIVVLSSARYLAPGKSKIFEWYDPDRFLAGIELFKADKAQILIFTGGFSPYNPEIPPEGNISTKDAISLGIPKAKIYTTKPVLNTLMEASAVSDILKNLENNNSKEIILVTSAFHMQRAKKIFEREGLIVEPYPVDFKQDIIKRPLYNPYYLLPNVSNLSKSSAGIRELFGRAYYRALR